MDKDKKLVTFELKDLTYEELVDTYVQVSDFLTFLQSSKIVISTSKSESKKEEEGENNES